MLNIDVSRGIDVFSGKKLVRQLHTLDLTPAGAERLYAEAVKEAAAVRGGWIRYWGVKSDAK